MKTIDKPEQLRSRLPIREAAKRVGRDWRYIRKLAAQNHITCYARGGKSRKYFEFYEDELRRDLDEWERRLPQTVRREAPRRVKTSGAQTLHRAALAM